MEHLASYDEYQAMFKDLIDRIGGVMDGKTEWHQLNWNDREKWDESYYSKENVPSRNTPRLLTGTSTCLRT